MTTEAGQSVKIVYFAWVRERIGRSEEHVALPHDIVTVGDLVRWLKSRGPEFDDAFRRPDVIRAALDRAHVKLETKINGAREIAFFPPVTGG